MAKRKTKVAAFILCLCLLVAPLRSFAASTSDAKELIDVDKSCSLTLSYSSNNTDFAGLSVKLYKIAEVSADFRYTLTPNFAGAGLNLNTVRSGDEWNTIRSTLEAYVLADLIAEDYLSITDAQGKAEFKDLAVGIYMVITDLAVTDTLECYFEPSLIVLPSLDASGMWNYDTAVTAKGQILPQEEEKTIKVVKSWKGDNKNSRPQSIKVEIYKESVLYETVTLTAKNNWSYSFEATDNGAKWTVIERDVPKGYTMTVSKKDNTFVLTNSKTPSPADPPKTGDTSNLMLYLVLMIISGLVLITLGFIGKKKDDKQS